MTSLPKSPPRLPTPASNFHTIKGTAANSGSIFYGIRLGFRGVYLSEGIADFVAGVITAIVIFTSFPRIFKQREALVKRGEAI